MELWFWIGMTMLRKLNFRESFKILLKITLKLLSKMKIKLLDSSKNWKKLKLLMILCTSNFTLLVPALGYYLYGLPKIHKEGVPMRPILSSIGTCGYNIAKFLVPFLQPLTINNYTVKDSISFVDEITNLSTKSHITMASFDIKSMFTL